MRLDESTATQLHEVLVHNGISISLRTVLRCREQLGWTFRGSAYCQLICEANEQKRLDWALQYRRDRFENVVFSDEASIQKETHRLRCYRKKGEKPKPKPQPKHPVKVHVWAGISLEGATDIAVFTGIMDAEFYVKLLDHCLVPFIRDPFHGREHRFMQDNDVKHVSCRAQHFFAENNINWWRTPPESPDLNPIENLWHKLKDFLWAKVKPAELKAGIKTFWATVTPAKYIGHLKSLKGDATGY